MYLSEKIPIFQYCYLFTCRQFFDPVFNFIGFTFGKIISYSS